jgi:hypothetical protein
MTLKKSIKNQGLKLLLSTGANRLTIVTTSWIIKELVTPWDAKSEPGFLPMWECLASRFLKRID